MQGNNQRTKRSAKRARVRRSTKTVHTAPLQELTRPHDLLARKDEFEPKLVDASGTQNVTWVGSVIDCFTPAQGVGYTQRTGDEVDLTGTEIRLSCTVAAALLASGALLRMIYFVWNDDSAITSPSVADVLSAGGSTLDTTVSPFNFANVRAGKFNILHDELVRVPGATGLARRLEFPVSSRVRFNVASTTGTGKLYLLLAAETAATAMVCAYHTRTFYSDA